MNVETFLDNFGHLAEAPNGIKKLRELILQLAVQGKLVPQDPSDESASALLKKIQAEKRRLIAEGKIRKTKPLPPLEPEEIPHELPCGWAGCRLGSYALITMGQSPPSKHYNDSGQGLPFYQGKADFGPVYPTPSKWCSVPLRVAEPDDVLISVRAPVGPTNLAREACCIGRGLSAIRPIAQSSPSFILYSIRAFETSIADLGVGSTFTAISRKDLENWSIAVPPLAEQKRIVAKVDELMALCDELEAKQQAKRAKQIALNRASLHALTQPNGTSLATTWRRVRDHFDDLYTVPETVAELRQTILQLAVMGRLVPQDPTDLPAPRPGKYFVYALQCEDDSIYIGQTQDVVERWKQHASGRGADWTKRHPPKRVVHWEKFDTLDQAVAREKELKTGFGRKWLKREIAAGRTRQAGEPAGVLLERIQAEKQRLIKEGKIRKAKPLPPIEPDEVPHELPDLWRWVRFGEVVDHRLGKMLDKQKNKGAPRPYLRNANVRWFGFDLSDLLTMRVEDDEFENVSVVAGDLVICEGGEPGRTAIWEKDEPIAIQKAIHRVRPLPGVFNRFVAYVMRSDTDSGRLEARFTGATIKHLTGRSLTAHVVPLPPLAEQKRIVAKVDQLMALCDDLEAKLQQAQTNADNLLAAIVHELAKG